MTKCNGCGLDHPKQQLDESGFCFECATYDPDPKPDLTQVMVDAAHSALDSLKKKISN